MGTAVNGLGIETIDPLGKMLGLQRAWASRLGSALIGPAGRRLVALFSGGAGPLSCQWRAARRRWVAERIGAADGEESVLE